MLKTYYCELKIGCKALTQLSCLQLHQGFVFSFDLNLFFLQCHLFELKPGLFESNHLLETLSLKRVLNLSSAIVI